jgi:cell division protease FtsH
LLEKHSVYYTISNPPNYAMWMSLLLFGLMIGLMLLLFSNMRRAQNQMMGGGFLSGFSRSPAKRYERSDQPITFDDVAGIEGVKADLIEIVDFLKDPGKFQKLGGRVPKGVLLIGPPGTGKTLLARAVAGEANVPFYSVNGSEFIQMFVGVGASRVRDLFNTAKANSPSIIFVDEIDAVGRQRGAGLGGGHDEREQTLNQILGEMDGFSGKDAVIVIAATNRPDVLDPALLRPGRFDRHVTVSRPTHKGRLAIFKVHVRHVPLADDVDLDAMAASTAGMTGADIANLVNEAALWAARNNKTCVEMSDFYYAQDKVLMGARREEVLSEQEKERTAYHEAGHTMAAWFLKGAPPVHKVTIIPRGRTLGVTQMIHEEDRMNMSEHEIRDYLVMVLAGRAAEKLVYNELTAGAESDLERGTMIARRMVTNWGMSERLGPVSYKTAEEDPFLGREIHQNRTFSEHTMEIIDEEVSKILQDAAHKALNFLRDRRLQLDALTGALLKNEELDQKEIREILGPAVHDERLNAKLAAESENGETDSSSASSDRASSGNGQAGSGADPASGKPPAKDQV